VGKKDGEFGDGIKGGIVFIVAKIGNEFWKVWDKRGNRGHGEREGVPQGKLQSSERKKHTR